jgi:succinoglycan biosynthesis protein ExoA
MSQHPTRALQYSCETGRVHESCCAAGRRGRQVWIRERLVPMAFNEQGCLVVVPTLNEEKYIARCLESLLHQTMGGFTIVVADGGSTDRTRAIVADHMRREPRVRLVENPGRLQSRAVNMVARRLGNGVKWLIRADAHTVYPPHFVEALLTAAQQVAACSVVVPMRAVGNGCFQRAAAAAQNSRLGNGGSLHRRGQSSQFVDHGHHALFELEHFRRVEGYDETFSHNEDFELDHRMREAGGKIWLACEAAVDYVPRATAQALARQYFLHGKGRARTIAKHGLVPRLRQVLPVLVLGGYVLAIGLAPWFPVMLLLPIAHLAACVSWGAAIGLRMRDLCAAGSGLCAPIMHLSWAIGFCLGLIKYWRTYRNVITPVHPRLQRR